ncbi:Putative coat protein [Rosellinia necatrix partitivirus 8]|uniref:Putative coat protein n=1 Tax=Rosellinia necatrix partitivirus 8 TaxID=2025333 RepID=UPI000C7F1066|nr:Putative coat protein [Rosellinia necatrix partitivirus 8]BBC21045.1 Putative coat protein [Rosellinia necatrix partitivirus 8]
MSSSRLRSTIPAPAAPTVTVQDGQPAAPASVAPQVLQYLDPSRNTDSNTGILFNLEWVPDFRFMLLSWLYSLARIVPNSAYTSSPYASPASSIGYTIVMLVAFLYHTDASHLQHPSAAASAIMNDALFSRFFDMLLDFPVPDFASNEFASLMAFLPDDIPNLVILTSLASADYYHDFGRHFSANIFFLAHNLLAGLPANTPTSTLRATFYATPVNSVNIGNNNNVNITPGQLFGRINGANTVSNWLNQRIDAMINSMAIRAVNQNNMVAQIQFPTVALANTANYNPYLFLASLDQHNIGSITSAMRNMSQWISATFPASKTLRHYMQAGSHETSNYLFAEIALPTWNTTQITITVPVSQTNSDKFLPTAAPDQNATELAHDSGFLTVPTAPADTDVNGTSVWNIAAERAASTPPANPMYASLRSSATRPDPYVNPIPHVTFDVNLHVLPRMYIYAPYVTNTGALGSVITSGKLIESGDISGIMQIVPSTTTPLLYENSQFHDGAIRLSRTRSALFHAGIQIHMQERPARRTLDAPIAFFRGLTSGLRYPVPSTGPVYAPSAFPNSSQARLLPGARWTSHATNFFHTLNVFGRDLSHDLQLHADSSFNIWSGLRFRYMTNTGPVVYVLPSARHIFGARARSYGTEHPALRLPL